MNSKLIKLMQTLFGLLVALSTIAGVIATIWWAYNSVLLLMGDTLNTYQTLILIGLILANIQSTVSFNNND